MKRKPSSPELAKAINRQAHLLAAKSFASIRTALEAQARAMLQAGRSLEETLQAIRDVGQHTGATEI